MAGSQHGAAETPIWQGCHVHEQSHATSARLSLTGTKGHAIFEIASTQVMERCSQFMG
jgi:hypothetical protein